MLRREHSGCRRGREGILRGALFAFPLDSSRKPAILRDMTTRQEVEDRMIERDMAESFGWHEGRIADELPVLFTDEEWDVMLNDPAFGYVCGGPVKHRMREADRRYGACLACEAEAEARYDEMMDQESAEADRSMAATTEGLGVEISAEEEAALAELFKLRNDPLFATCDICGEDLIFDTAGTCGECAMQRFEQERSWRIGY